VTSIPSLDPSCTGFTARRLATLTCRSTRYWKTDHRPEVGHGQSTQQARNIDGSLAVSVQALRAAPVLLVDDMVDSRWTLTVAAWLLRSHGSGEVFPLALALTGYET
jgi:ATP-dependent DNA helicase RecQ